MWAHSGYTFESGSEKIFKKVHAAKGVIHQIVRVMTMIQLNLWLILSITLGKKRVTDIYKCYKLDLDMGSDCEELCEVSFISDWIFAFC